MVWFWSGGPRRSERKWKKDSRSQKCKQVAGSRRLERERERVGRGPETGKASWMKGLPHFPHVTQLRRALKAPHRQLAPIKGQSLSGESQDDRMEAFLFQLVLSLTVTWPQIHLTFHATSPTLRSLSFFISFKVCF